jgi:IPT/TIG domain
MSLSTLLRVALLPVAVVMVVTACAAPPPDLGGLDDRTLGDGKPSKGPPAKQPEPTDQPAPKGDVPPPATPQADQAPTLASITPDAITVGDAPNGIALTLVGTRFAATSQVSIAGTNFVAKVLNAQQLEVQVPADKVKQIGALRISVLAKPGLESNPLSFTVANPKTVTIATLAPASIVMGVDAADVALSVTGTGYTAESVIRFNGAALATTFVSSTALKATIPAIAFLATGRFAVTVATGTDVVSLPSPFEVRNPSPATAAVAPATVTMGDGATVVTISGSRFTRASEVFAQNAPLATTFVSATQLRATVPSYLITKTGALALVVTTGAPGGGTSSALMLTVKAGQSTTTGASCAYRCGDYGYPLFTCFSNWYCIGMGESAGCLAQIACTDTVIATTNSCQYECSEYLYEPGDCLQGYYCNPVNDCLERDSVCD